MRPNLVQRGREWTMALLDLAGTYGGLIVVVKLLVEMVDVHVVADS